jgi:hypothetical protein
MNVTLQYRLIVGCQGVDNSGVPVRSLLVAFTDLQCFVANLPGSK